MTNPNSTNLLIIDGFNILYRAFHGNEKLTSPSGEPTGAIHGFLRTLGVVQKKFPGYNTVITLDNFPHGLLDAELQSSGRNPIDVLPDFGGASKSRREILPTYKSNRSAMPDDMQKQIWPLLLILQAHGYPLLQGNEIIEADDLLAALAVQGASRGVKVAVCTGDKDGLALIKDDSICVFNPNTNLVMTEASVWDKFGVRPDQMEDFLALMGDAVDCIPGVAKCGEKTAAKWLNAYGDLQGIIDHADEIKGVVGENLRAAIPKLGISRELSTLRRDIELDYTSCVQPKPRDDDLLRHIYTALGMKMALKTLDATAPTP